MEVNKIYCENNLETMARMPDGFIDLTVTSPPYNLGGERVNGNFKKKKYYEYKDDLTFTKYCDKTKIWINEMLRVTKYHVFYNIQETQANKGILNFINSSFSEYIKEVFVWAKTNPPSHIVDTSCSHGYEHIFCLSHDNPNKRQFTYCNFSNRKGDYVKNVFIRPVNSGKENFGHGHAFPEWMPKFFIHYFSKKGDLIYDPFMGSGTTAKMAHLLKRRWIGSEISQEYVDLANKRLQPYLNQLTMDI